MNGLHYFMLFILACVLAWPYVKEYIPKIQVGG